MKVCRNAAGGGLLFSFLFV